MKMQKVPTRLWKKRRRVLGLLGRFWITSIFTSSFIDLDDRDDGRICIPSVSHWGLF